MSHPSEPDYAHIFSSHFSSSYSVISGYTKRTVDGKELYDVTFKTPDIMPLVSEDVSYFVHYILMLPPD